MFDPARVQQEGQLSAGDDDQSYLNDLDYVPCRNQRCNFMVSPETQDTAHKEGGYTCPNCSMSYGVLDPTPFGNEHTNGQQSFTPGGGTRAGFTPTQMGQMAEGVVQKLGDIPGYGPITWWSQDYNNPLDGGTAEWGLEVKGRDRNSVQQFYPGKPWEKIDKDKQAMDMGYKGIVGVLVILDFNRSLADIYVKEYPFRNEPYETVRPTGEKSRNEFRSIGFYRAAAVPKLVEETPFDNPLLDPKDVSPQPYHYESNADIPF